MLRELTASTRRLALVGLAKNTGKTVALTALLRELEDDGRRVGVTSVGRDGEERDVIDARIEKPRIALVFDAKGRSNIPQPSDVRDPRRSPLDPLDSTNGRVCSSGEHQTPASKAALLRVRVEQRE